MKRQVWDVLFACLLIAGGFSLTAGARDFRSTDYPTITEAIAACHAAGVDLVVPSLRTRVFEIVPVAETVAPTSIFTAKDLASLYALRQPELAEAAAWDRHYEAHNKVEKPTGPLGVYK